MRALMFLFLSTNSYFMYEFDITFAVQIQSKGNRDVAQPGSALRSGRRGRGFESSHPDTLFLNHLFE